MYIRFILCSLTLTVFLLYKLKNRRIYGTYNRRVFFNMFVLFGVCNFSSGNRAAGIRIWCKNNFPTPFMQDLTQN